MGRGPDRRRGRGRIGRGSSRRGRAGRRRGLGRVDPVDLRAQRSRSGLAGLQGQLLGVASAGQGRLLGLEQVIHALQRPRTQRLGLGQLAVSGLELGQPRRGAVCRRLVPAGDRDDALLYALGAAQEVDLFEQVVEPAGVQYDGDQIGPVALVAGHQLAREQHPRPGQPLAQPDHQRPLAAQGGGGPSQRGLIDGQLLANRRLAALHQRDLAVQRGDQPGQRGQARAQLVLVGLLLGELRVELGKRGRRGRGGPARDRTGPGRRPCTARAAAVMRTARRRRFIGSVRGYGGRRQAAGRLAA